MKIDGHVYVDGGVMQGVDVGSIIRRCNELGYKNSDIVVDIVLTSMGKPK